MKIHVSLTQVGAEPIELESENTIIENYRKRTFAR